MTESRWQIISRDTDDVFGILRGEETYLSTVRLPYMGRIDGEDNDIFIYESCLFTKDGSEVLSRYNSKELAIEGHNRLAKKYNLK
jgi:hypothetical protein